jgi:hypothetical protein
VSLASDSRLRKENPLPEDQDNRQIFLIRWFLGITFLLGCLALIDQRQFADEIAVWAVSPNWRWAIRIGWILNAVVGIALLSTWTKYRGFVRKAISVVSGLTNRIGMLRWLVLLALPIMFPILLLGPYGRFVLPFFTRLLIFWGFVSIGTWIAESLRPARNLIFVFTAIVLVFGTAYRIAVFSADISTYPFSLGWSEASRYYYASLFLSERIYEASVPPSVLHPTRYLIQAVPFLIPGATLLVHRLWQVIVWTALTFLAGFVFARRLGLQSQASRWLLIIWSFLFLFQGPVWYHLLVMVILIIWGTRSDNPVTTLGIVFLASVWAGISRVNWIPVPAMLAALLYFLEKKRTERGLIEYFAWPAIWFAVGTAAGFFSQWFYIYISGNEAGRFGSSFESPLLWYRLLPSGTYPLGVLAGIFLASLPIAILVAYRFLGQGWKVEPLRLIAILAVPAVLFAGGILVSVKIGGGSNLHNLDAFLAALMILGVYTGTNHWQLDDDSLAQRKSIPTVVFMVMIWMPICFAIGMGKPLRSFDMQQASRVMEQIRSIVEPIAESNGKVLFISQRHLLSFGKLEGVDLIPEYETVFLMEMAMSRNEPYLAQFHEDLSEQRFDLIVVDRLSTQIQGRNDDFAEENNAWVEEVSRPIVCHYGIADGLSSPPLDFYMPLREQSVCDS